jgi:hypothetical protein
MGPADISKIAREYEQFYMHKQTTWNKRTTWNKAQIIITYLP